jgi:hypothetical protein
VRHARHAAHRIEDPVKQAHAAGRVRTHPLRVDIHNQYAVGIEPEWHARESREGPDEQSRTNDERQRQRNLKDDEAAGHGGETTRASRRRRVCLCPHLEDIQRGDPGGAERRYRPENARRHECDSRGERHDPPVEREIERDLLDRRRQLSHERLTAPLSDDEPADRTEHRENETLDQQWPRETAAGRAQRQPNAELVPARRGACQQQVGDVDARDQQHEQCNHEDREQGTCVGLSQPVRSANGE